MIGLAAVAHPFIVVVLTDKWSFAAILLQIICFNMMWYPIHSINLNLLQVKGRSDLFLKLEVWKKCIGVVILCITVPLGLVAMCWGTVASSLICLIINTHYTGKLLQVGFLTQMRDLLPSLAYSLSMGAVVWITVGLLPDNKTSLSVGIITGIFYFFIVTKLTRSSDLRELMSFVKTK